MNVLSEEFYCGLPQYLWDDLLYKTEDLFRTEDIGSHIVGIYPAGDRIFGIESESPALLCLYVDTIESLINPCSLKAINRDSFIKEYSLAIDQSKTYFVELYDWVRWIVWRQPKFVHMELFDLIPVSHDILHQDSSIDEIIQLARELLSIHYPITIKPPYCFDRNNLKSFLYLRTAKNWAKFNRFKPNLNNNWEKVYKEQENEAEIIDCISNGKPMTNQFIAEIYDDLLIDLPEKKLSEEKILRQKEAIKEIGKGVEKLYRYLL